MSGTCTLRNNSLITFKCRATYTQHWYSGANIEISSWKGFPKLKKTWQSKLIFLNELIIKNLFTLIPRTQNYTANFPHCAT